MDVRRLSEVIVRAEFLDTNADTWVLYLPLCIRL